MPSCYEDYSLKTGQAGNVQYSGDLKSDHLKSRHIWNFDFFKVGFQIVGFPNGLALATAIVIVPTIQKLDHSTILSGFQMVFYKIEALCLDFKWLGFRNSDPIQNPDHLKLNLFSTIQNPDWSGF